MSDPQSNAPSIIDTMRRRIDYEQKLREYMLAFIEQSQRKKDPYVEIWDELFENYLVSFETEKSGGKAITFNQGIFAQSSQPSQERRSRLKDPETHQIVESLSAQALGLLIGSKDYITAVPTDENRIEDARKLSKILMGTLDGPGNFRTIYEVLKNAFIFGTSIIEVGWEERARKAVVIEPIVDPEFGVVVGRQQVVRDVVYRRRPMIKEVDRYNFYPDPAGTRIQENMKGVAKRFGITRDEIIGLAARGTYNNVLGVRRLLSRMEQDPKAKIEDDMHVGGPEAPLPPVPIDEFGKAIGFEYWGFIPFRTPDGIQNRVVTMIGGEIVRDDIIPYLMGKLPFKEVVMNPISGRFWGLSPAEAIRYLQDSTDNFFMVANDAADLAIRQPLLVGTRFNGNIRELQRREPNSTIVVGDVEAVKPLDINLGALQYAMSELNNKKQMMREASGATDPVQAISGGGRRTKYEVQELSRAASTRVEMMVQLVERDDFPWLGTTIHERLKQYMPEGGMVATHENEAVPFNYDNIDLEVDVHFNGSRHAQSPGEIAEALTNFIQTVGAAPQVLFLLPDVITRLYRDGFKIEDAAKMVAAAAQRYETLRLMDEESEADAAASAPPAGSRG